jgi:hypothetical protein
MSRHICCLSWPKVGLLLHAGELPGSHVVLLSVISSMWIAIKTQVRAVLFLNVWQSNSFDARPSFWADLSTYVQRAFVNRLRLVLRAVQNSEKILSSVPHEQLDGADMLLTQPIRWPPSAMAADEYLKWMPYLNPRHIIKKGAIFLLSYFGHV